MRLLDTNHLSVLEWEDTPRAIRLQEKMAACPAAELGTTIVNFEEQMRGWMSGLNDPTKSVKEHIEMYRRLKRQLQLYCKVAILDFDERVAVEFQRLKKECRGVGTLDLKIAAIAIANDAILLTENLKDFRKVPGLQIENWLA
jgi:tRNA(fMet)-specific endonuclease VapC